MRLRNSTGLMAGVILVTVMTATWLQARVYHRAGVPAGDLFNPGSFGREIYQAVMQINGGRADVSVVVCEEGLAAVRAAFSALAGHEPAMFMAGESMGCGLAVSGDRTVRVVTLAPEAEAPLLMVMVRQPTGESAASRSAPTRNRMDEVPVPPDATVLSYQKNDDTRTALERVSSRMAREDLARYYEAAMAQKGWIRGSRVAARPGLSVYVKGADLCWVRIGDTDSNGETRVTLLNKPGAVK